MHEQEQSRCHQGPDDCASVVHGPVKAVRSAAILRRRCVRDHRVPGRSGSLAHPVGKPEREHLGPRTRKGNERTDDIRKRIPRSDPALPTLDAVRQVARVELEEGGRRFCDSLDDAEGRGARAEHGREKNRKERVDHLRCRVVQQAYKTENDDIFAQTFCKKSRYSHLHAPHRSSRCAARNYCSIFLSPSSILLPTIGGLGGEPTVPWGKPSPLSVYGPRRSVLNSRSHRGPRPTHHVIQTRPFFFQTVAPPFNIFTPPTTNTTNFSYYILIVLPPAKRCVSSYLHASLHGIQGIRYFAIDSREFFDIVYP